MLLGKSLTLEWITSLLSHEHMPTKRYRWFSDGFEALTIWLKLLSSLMLVRGRQPLADSNIMTIRAPEQFLFGEKDIRLNLHACEDS